MLSLMEHGAMSTKPANINPLVSPTYADLVVMPNGKALQKAAFLKSTEIEALLKHSPTYQTINRMLAGQPGNYTGVHRVFTAINMTMGGSLNRAAEVLIHEKGRAPQPDPVLADCAVFPRLEEYLSRLSISQSGIGDQALVATRYVDHMVAGRPVARNLVEQVFAAVNRGFNGTLELGKDVFG